MDSNIYVNGWMDGWVGGILGCCDIHIYVFVFHDICISRCV